MKLGIDFDNTIICYDDLFHRVALERGLIPEILEPDKRVIRDHLRTVGKEDEWTRMQGYVYGCRLMEAKPFKGVLEFFIQCNRRSIPVRIISHKTRYPYAGERYDLHEAACQWLEFQGFFRAEGIGLSKETLFFEPTQEKKIQRIIKSECTHFIDDLPEFLMRDDFPGHVNKILYRPGMEKGHPTLTTVQSWENLSLLFNPWT